MAGFFTTSDKTITVNLEQVVAVEYDSAGAVLYVGVIAPKYLSGSGVSTTSCPLVSFRIPQEDIPRLKEAMGILLPL